MSNYNLISINWIFDMLNLNKIKGLIMPIPNYIDEIETRNEMTKIRNIKPHINTRR